MNSSPIRSAIIGSLLVIILALILHFTDNSYNKAASSIAYLILVVSVIMSIYFFKKIDKNGAMTFKEGFLAGMRTTLIFALIGCIWMIFYIKVVNPEFMTVIKQKQLDELVKQGLSDEQIEESLPMLNKFMTIPFMFISAFMMYTLTGIVITLITSAILKNRTEYDLPTQ